MPEWMIEEDLYRRIFNFVANIEGNLYVLANVVDIPDGLKNGFDPSKYSYDFDDSVLGRSD